MIKLILSNLPKNKPLIIDADGLWFLSKFYDTWPELPKLTILTPNVVEWSRIKKMYSEDDHLEEHERSKLFKNFLQKVIVLEKGEIDQITIYGQSSELPLNKLPEIDRRCGGQGDILTGILATYLNWFMMGDNHDSEILEIFIQAACETMRVAGLQAFEKKYYGTLATDIIEEIPSVFYNFCMQAWPEFKIPE